MYVSFSSLERALKRLIISSKLRLDLSSRGSASTRVPLEISKTANTPFPLPGSGVVPTNMECRASPVPAIG